MVQLQERCKIVTFVLGHVPPTFYLGSHNLWAASFAEPALAPRKAADSDEVNVDGEHGWRVLLRDWEAL